MSNENSKYSINIVYVDENNGFIVTSKEYPGVSAFGTTHEKALEEMKIAISLANSFDNPEGLKIVRF